ncbi:MAG: PolC-type DNA polymerase III, partial [Bacilli bacterium]|nr:PolC-type DNA polymerase III [Bacilli bacterium]
RLASFCQDVKRTTGQHPGGIVVIPREFEVYDFTPIQYPANEKESSWKTTHFDFHAIHDNVLKLDLLGHVDPTAMRFFLEESGIDPQDLPMNDPDTLSLFSKPDALKLKHNYLNEKTGALGLPEFGTRFVRGMLEKTHPQKFSDLVILSGLSHGTDVWAGNAETLVDNKTCILSEVIGCRDDIMVYLSAKGLPPLTAFKIMEDVRKGKGLTEEYEKIMKVNNVPDWYIDSCKKIKYMFPKAHATAYVMMAVRVAWFKVHKPLYYYAHYFSLRCEKFDLEAMMKGEDGIIKRLEEISNKRKNKEDVSAKEEEIEKTLQSALEMVDRGYKFGKLDINKSRSTKWYVDEETQTIIPPFTAIDGLGEAVAESVVKAREEKPFLSIEDVQQRTKLSKSHIQVLKELKALESLSESNQLNLFSFDF